METNAGYRYIIAEDESLIRKNLIKKIESLKLPFILAGEAANGLDAIRLTKESGPSLIITDIRMPQCDGLELLRYLHINHPGIKTIILSGYNDFSYAQTALRYGVRDYLLKPVTQDALSRTMHQMLMTMDSEAGEVEQYRIEENRLDQTTIYKMLETYLLENYHSDISFQLLADKFGFTQEYIGKIFKKHTGTTPSKYLARLRINEAKRLLLSHPEIEIQQVGRMVGYKDGFYFSRVFKNHTGMQPSEFRNQKG